MDKIQYVSEEFTLLVRVQKYKFKLNIILQEGIFETLHKKLSIECCCGCPHPASCSVGPLRTFLGSRAVVAYSQPLTQIHRQGKVFMKAVPPFHKAGPYVLWCGEYNSTFIFIFNRIDIQENDKFRYY